MPCNHGAGKKLHKFQCRACACLPADPACLPEGLVKVCGLDPGTNQGLSQAPITGLIGLTSQTRSDSITVRTQHWGCSSHQQFNKKNCFIIFMRKRSFPLPCISQKWKGWHFDSYFWTTIAPRSNWPRAGSPARLLWQFGRHLLESLICKLC